MLRGCDLDDATLATLVTTGALAPHLGALRMITLHENNPRLRAIPPELLTAILQHITVAGPAGRVSVPDVHGFTGAVGVI